jgi:PPOX class probable F420-dependent enzyme
MNSAQPFDPADEPYVSLASYRRNGVEVRTPVWIAAAGGRYYVFSAGDAGKVKRIRNDPRVRLAACDVRGKIRGEWNDGTATLISDPARLTPALRAMRKKYGLQMRVIDFFSRLSGKINRRAYIEIAMDPRGSH